MVTLGLVPKTIHKYICCWFPEVQRGIIRNLFSFAFQMSRLIISNCEALVTPDTCESFICEVELASSTTLVTWKGHPPEKGDRQTIL